MIARIYTQPFILDHGDDTTDFPGDEFLLGYWLGRYVGGDWGGPIVCAEPEQSIRARGLRADLLHEIPGFLPD